MVKPSVFATDPSQEKAQEKANEAEQVQVPFITDKFHDELAVKIKEGAKPQGGCASLPRWQKVTIVLIATLVIVTCLSFISYKLFGLFFRCGNDGRESGLHRWDKMKGDFDGQYPFEGGHWDDSHGSSEEHGHGRPGGGSHGEDDDHHHGPGHHGPHGGPDHGPHGGPDHGPHGGPDHGPHGGPHPGPHPGPPPSGHPGPHPSGPPGPHPEHGGHEHYEDEDMDERDHA